MLLILVVSILFLFLFYFIRKSKYWESRGVPGPKPLPILGNIGANLIGKKSTYEISADIYKQYPNDPFVGIFRMGTPSLIIRDPEIIKNVLVKDFSHFVNNDIYVDKKLDPLLGMNPFVLNDDEWKKTRQLLSPGFAPAKIKTLFPYMEKVAKNFAKYLKTHEGEALNLKDLCGRYTCDTVALSAFALEGNSFEDPNAQFLQIVRTFVTPGTWQAFKFAISFYVPYFKMKLMPKCFDDAVINITKEILKYRKENNVKRNDYFEAISQIPSGSLVEIAAHLSGFIVDGYETSSSALTFIFYELAKNPKCQQKLREEINTVLEKNKGELSVEILKDMTYLEACINEGLRLHPPLAQLTRTCNKSYTVSTISPELNKLSVTLEPGLSLIFPLLGLHMDPKYFPSPEEFIPERFLDKNDANKYVYMPFGTGLRTCLGSRLALLQSKVALATIFKDFEISLDEKLKKPMKYDTMYFLLNPKGGAWINSRKIS
uniref:Cytochrome P450 n=1 Tax=Anoplophora glabripennis TaxID=217634 RepID=A0A8F8QSP3_ANOGL|nr:cytochrome P450 [Anoplophora glabripennis]